LACKSDETAAHVGKWTKDEDSTLKDAVEKHNGKNRTAIAALVPGRTKTQCKSRWHDALESKSDEMIARAGRWTTDEDITLKNAVKKHNRENWAAISAMVPGRTKRQCKSRWYGALDSKHDETIARAGKWTTDEEITLKNAVEKHNGEDWAAISELVLGRTKTQRWHRWYRWHNSLGSKSDETTARVGKWTNEEDDKLQDAVEKHKGEDWVSISELLLGRTKTQCWHRWHNSLRFKTDETGACVGKCTTDEDSKLKAAVEKHNGKRNAPPMFPQPLHGSIGSWLVQDSQFLLGPNKSVFDSER
jgi:hypothetical protein